MDDAQVAKLIRLVAMLAPWGAVKGEPLQLPDDTDLHELAGIARELLVHVAEHPIGAMAIKQRQAIEHRWMVAARATQREARLLGLMSADPEARIHLHVCQCLEEQGIDPNADSERPNSAGVGFELSQDIQDAHLSVLVEIVEGLGENLTEKQTRLRRLVLKAVQHG